jgi:hypothetical protein
VSTPKEQWQITDALIYSVDWIPPSRHDMGHYEVVYSYKAGAERYTGGFSDYSSEQPLHRDDVISIRCCPEDPQKSFYPDRETAIGKRLLLFGIGAGVGVLVTLIKYLGSHR